MSFLEPVLAAVVGACFAVFATKLKKNKTAQTILKYGPVIQKAYNIIDPVLDKNLHKWSGSQVDKAFELAVEAAADSKLTPGEIREITFYMAQAWLPQKAADKVRSLESLSTPTPELLTAVKVASKVNSILH